MADGLRVQVATVFLTYAGSIDISELAGEIVHADRLRRGEIAATPPVIVDLGAAGRLVAALAPAARCVSRNSRDHRARRKRKVDRRRGRQGGRTDGHRPGPIAAGR
jgi:hypothetical protein